MNMFRKTAVALAVVLVMLAMVLTAQAADVFRFTENGITLGEGGTRKLELRREGAAAEGEVTFFSGNENIVSVSPDGTVTALAVGRTSVSAELKTEKRVYKTKIDIKVETRVTDVELQTGRLAVFDPADPAVSGLLPEGTDLPVILLSAGKSISLNASVTPAGANRKVNWSVNDPEVARLRGNTLQGLKAGACVLTVSSVQDDQVARSYRVLVMQPVKAVKVEADAAQVAAGSTLALRAILSPEDATVREVEWSTSTPKLVSVDSSGVVTGLKKGRAVVTATAKDGTGRQGSVRINVTQPVTGVHMEAPLIMIQQHGWERINAVIEPQDADNRTMHWSVSDESVITVRGDKVGASVNSHNPGTATLTGTTDDGGFTATTEVLVDDFNGAIVIEKFYVTASGSVRLTLRNDSRYDISEIRFFCVCYDWSGQPMICNASGSGTEFHGAYLETLSPGEETDPYILNISDAAMIQRPAAIVVYLRSYRLMDKLWSYAPNLRPRKIWGDKSVVPSGN